MRLARGSKIEGWLWCKVCSRAQVLQVGVAIRHCPGPHRNPPEKGNAHKEGQRPQRKVHKVKHVKQRCLWCANNWGADTVRLAKPNAPIDPGKKWQYRSTHTHTWKWQLTSQAWTIVRNTLGNKNLKNIEKIKLKLYSSGLGDAGVCFFFVFPKFFNFSPRGPPQRFLKYSFFWCFVFSKGPSQ